jgi:uroporphyrinogen-III synthase
MEDAPARPDTVLITRPEPGATETADRISAMRLVPIVAPVLNIRFPPVRLPPPNQLAAVLFASGNAVEPLPAAYHALPVLTVGDATSRRARHAGFADVASADGDAAALADLVRSRFSPGAGTLLLATGRGQSLPLASTLRALGYRVSRRVVYSAEPMPGLPEPALAALRDSRLSVLFFSAETARCFMRLVRAAELIDTLKHHDAITIGAQAAMALREGHWSRVRVAGKPTQDEMLALLR